jgi:hypothetical protein
LGHDYNQVWISNICNQKLSIFFKEKKKALNQIKMGPRAHVSKEQWSVSKMLLLYNAKFIALLQIIYHREMVSYFSNMTAIVFMIEN